MPDYSPLIEKAKKILPTFEPIARRTPHEAKGVLYSDILFMLACLDDMPVRRVLESGRARGQSTLLLAQALPNTEIISIEFDENSPDVPVAKERLKSYKNVTLLFGDSRLLLPEMVQDGDVVIIDGPKMFLAIRLALRLLATKKASHVFMHDMTVNTPWRRFLDKFFPEARFSDQKELAEITSLLDDPIRDSVPPAHQLGGFEGEYGYGNSLGYLPYVADRPYRLLLFVSFMYDLFEPSPAFRIRRKLKKWGIL